MFLPYYEIKNVENLVPLYKMKHSSANLTAPAMATNQQHTAGIPSTEGLTIDEIPTVSPLKPNNDMSQEDAPNASREK